MLRRLIDRFRRRRNDDRPAETSAPRNYGQERDDSRRAQMSQEVQDWEAASQQRARETQERNQPPPVQ
jgi:hypothetical protein